MRSRLCSLRIVCRTERLHTGMSRVEMDGCNASALDMPSNYY